MQNHKSLTSQKLNFNVLVLFSFECFNLDAAKHSTTPQTFNNNFISRKSFFHSRKVSHSTLNWGEIRKHFQCVLSYLSCSARKRRKIFVKGVKKFFYSFNFSLLKPKETKKNSKLKISF